MALRESAGTPYGRPRLRLRLPTPTASCPHHPGHHERLSDDPRSVLLALKHPPQPASLKFLPHWIGLQGRVLLGPVPAAALGKASPVGSAPPPLSPSDPHVPAASNPSGEGANLLSLYRLQERKGIRVTSEPYSRRFLGRGVVLPLRPPPHHHHFRLSDLQTGESEGSGPARARRTQSSSAGHSGSARPVPAREPQRRSPHRFFPPFLLRPSPPLLLAPRSRDPLARAGPRRAPCALTAISSRPGARGSLLGESLEAATWRRACDSGAAVGSVGEIGRPRPRRGPSPPSCPPSPPGRGGRVLRPKAGPP